MAVIAAKAPGEPLNELNTTPLIDVMLVLLVMFIMTIPIATHSLDVDLPRPAPTHMVHADRNLLTVTSAGNFIWNGDPVSDEELAALLAQARAARPEPQIEYRPAPDTSYDRAAQALALVERSGVTNFGFSGNERYRRFGRGD